MQESDKQLIQQAIARNAGIVISFPSAGSLRHHKSRFLAETPQGIWVEAPDNDDELISQLLQTSEPIGASFRHGHTKGIYRTRLLERREDYQINPQLTAPALLTEFPEEIKTIQRRGNYRALVPGDSELKVRIWRIGPGVPVRDRPMAKQEIRSALRDISLGGIGVFLEGESGAPPKISPSDRLRIHIKSPAAELILEGRMRYPEVVQAARVRAGVEFKSLEKNIEGRQALASLTRIVGELTRAELRRLRIGLPPVAA